MFTGIVQAVGTVRSLEGGRLTIDTPAEWPNAADPWEMGESISVSGTCLTLVDWSDGLAFDLSEETIARTSWSVAQTGLRVNLERAMTANQRFGGHFVQGHVDTRGHVTAVTPHDGSVVMEFEVAEDWGRYLVDKGSICIDGVSLTVIKPDGGQFSVSLIPHTWDNTSLHQRQSGDVVNVEFDVLAKHVEQLLRR